MCVNTICCSLQHSEKSLKRRRRLNGHLRSSMWQQQDWDGGRWGCSGYQSSKGNGSVDKKKNQIIVSVEEAVLILNWSSRHPPPANAHPFFYLRGYLDWRRSGCRFLSALKKSWQVSPSFKAPIKIFISTCCTQVWPLLVRTQDSRQASIKDQMDTCSQGAAALSCWLQHISWVLGETQAVIPGWPTMAFLRENPWNY